MDHNGIPQLHACSTRQSLAAHNTPKEAEKAKVETDYKMFYNVYFVIKSKTL